MSPPITILKTGDVDLTVAIYLGEDGRGGVKETMWTDRGMEVAIDFIVPWEKRIPFLYSLRGSCGYDGQNYWRKLPFALPEIDADQLGPISENKEPDAAYPWPRYYCSSIGELRTIQSRTDQGDEDGLTGVPGWPYAKEVIVPTRWTVPLYTVADDPYDPQTPGKDPSGFPYTVTKFHTSGQMFSPYTATYKFEHETTAANEANVGILRLRKEIIITRYFMPVLNDVDLDDLQSKINADPITIGKTTYPPESIMYMGYEPEPYINPANGRIVWDVAHRLLANGPVLDPDGNPVQSWNYFMNRSGAWDKLVGNKTGKPVYETANFGCKIWPEYVECDD